MWIPCCDYILADGTISSRKCLKRENILPLRVPLETKKALLENVKFKWKIFCQKIKSKAVLENVKGQSESALIRNFWHQFTACEATHWLIIACASQSLLLFFLIYWSCVKCALPFIPPVPEVAVIRSGNCWRLRGSRLLPPRIIIFIFSHFFSFSRLSKYAFFISYIFSIGKLVEIGEPISGVPQSTIVYCWHARRPTFEMKTLCSDSFCFNNSVLNWYWFQI